MGFFAGLGVPKGIDQGPRADVPVAAAIDLFLLLLLAVQHTVMARPWFKRRWTRIVPGPAGGLAQAGGRAAVSARVGMFAPSGLFAAMAAVAGLATGRRLIRVPEGRPVVLRDGSAVLIRQVRSTDAPPLADGFGRLKRRIAADAVPGG